MEYFGSFDALRYCAKVGWPTPEPALLKVMYRIARAYMCHEVKIFLNFAFVYGARSARPSSCIGFCAYARSSGVRYHARVISGKSGSRKNPDIAMGREMIPSTTNSHCQPFSPPLPP